MREFFKWIFLICIVVVVAWTTIDQQSALENELIRDYTETLENSIGLMRTVRTFTDSRVEELTTTGTLRTSTVQQNTQLQRTITKHLQHTEKLLFRVVAILRSTSNDLEKCSDEDEVCIMPLVAIAAYGVEMHKGLLEVQEAGSILLFILKNPPVTGTEKEA